MTVTRQFSMTSWQRDKRTLAPRKLHTDLDCIEAIYLCKHIAELIAFLKSLREIEAAPVFGDSVFTKQRGRRKSQQNSRKRMHKWVKPNETGVTHPKIAG